MDECKNFVTANYLQSHWKILPAELLDFIHSGLPAYRQTGIVIEAAELSPEKTLSDITKELALRAARDSEARKCRSFITLTKIPNSFRRPTPPPATTETLSDIHTEAQRVFEKLRSRKDNQTLTDLNTFLFKREEINKFAKLHELKLIDEAEAPPQDSKTTAQPPMSAKSCVPEMEDLGGTKEKSETWNELAKPRWYTGQWLVENKKIEGFQLFDLLNADVQAFTRTGQKVVDRDPLLRKEFTLEHLKEEAWRLENYARGTEETGKVITGRSCGGRQERRKQLSRIKTDKNALRKFEKLPKDKWTDPKGCKSISFTLPDDDIGRITAILEAKTFRYVSAGVDKYFGDDDVKSPPLPSQESQSIVAEQQPSSTFKKDTSVPSPITPALHQDTTPIPAAPPAPIKTTAINFFRSEDTFWHIGYEGKDKRIKHIRGLKYIGYLLERPGKPISCRELYQATSGATPDNIMPEGVAISEGLNIGRIRIPASDYEAKQEYHKRYQKLADDLDEVEDNPEGATIRKEIEKEMAEIEPRLTERALPDKETKNQQNGITKALDRAYTAIEKGKMKDMEKYLRNHIEKDGKYNLTYTGTLLWDITL